jgi:diguanylate cyclase
LTTAYFWLTFRVPEKEKGKNILLELNSIHTDTAALYRVENGKSSLLAEIGDRIPFSKRPMMHPKLLFPLPATEISGEFLLMIDKQGGSANFPLYLWERNSFEIHDSKETVLWFLFMGALVFFIAISILLAFIFKKQVFFCYCFFVFTNLCYQLLTSGFSFAYLYPNNIWMNDFLRFLILPLLGISFLLFTKYFFEINRSYSRLENGCNSLIFILVLLLGMGLIPGMFHGQCILLPIHLLYGSMVAASFWSLWVITKVWNRHKNRSILYLLAFSGNIVVLFFNIATEYGVLEKSLVSFNPILLANIQEIWVMTMGMYLYISKVKGERNDLRMEKKQKNETDIQIRGQIQKHIQPNPLSGSMLPNESFTSAYPYILKDKSILNLSDVLYIKSMDHYVLFIFETKKVLERISLKELFMTLDTKIFIQVHRSYVVNKHYVKKATANKIILSNNQTVPLSRTYKAKFTEESFKKYS